MNICERIVEGNLKPKDLSFKHKATVCKYLVPEGYPEAPRTHETITVDENALKENGGIVFFASVNVDKGHILTTSSRTVAVLGISDTIGSAEEIAESSIQFVKGPLRHRKDIGTASLLAKRVDHVQMIRGTPVVHGEIT
jgi:phosphoribosylamine--glycine ligase